MKQFDDSTPPPEYYNMSQPETDQRAFELGHAMVDREPASQPLMEGHRQTDGPVVSTILPRPHPGTGVSECRCQMCGSDCVSGSYPLQCLCSSSDNNHYKLCCAAVVFLIVVVVIAVTVAFCYAVSAPASPPPAA